ncbi:MAG: hypothetical protein ACRENE_13085 [Polyangiaceae bacterium]
MRVESQSTGRVLGYVQVQVASRTYALRVEALPPKSGAADRRQPGFFTDDDDGYGIFVDGDAPQAVVDQTIEQASLDATRHISRKVLN